MKKILFVLSIIVCTATMVSAQCSSWYPSAIGNIRFCPQYTNEENAGMEILNPDGFTTNDITSWLVITGSFSNEHCVESTNMEVCYKEKIGYVSNPFYNYIQVPVYLYEIHMYLPDGTEMIPPNRYMYTFYRLPYFS